MDLVDTTTQMGKGMLGIYKKFDNVRFRAIYSVGKWHKKQELKILVAEIFPSIQITGLCCAGEGYDLIIYISQIPPGPQFSLFSSLTALKEGY